MFYFYRLLRNTDAVDFYLFNIYRHKMKLLSKVEQALFQIKCRKRSRSDMQTQIKSDESLKSIKSLTFYKYNTA